MLLHVDIKPLSVILIIVLYSRNVNFKSIPYFIYGFILSSQCSFAQPLYMEIYSTTVTHIFILPNVLINSFTI